MVLRAAAWVVCAVRMLRGNILIDINQRLWKRILAWGRHGRGTEVNPVSCYRGASQCTGDGSEGHLGIRSTAVRRTRNRTLS